MTSRQEKVVVNKAAIKLTRMRHVLYSPELAGLRGTWACEELLQLVSMSSC